MLPAKKARIGLCEGGFPPRYFRGSSDLRIYVTGRVVSLPILKPLAIFELQRALMLFQLHCLVIRGA